MHSRETRGQDQLATRCLFNSTSAECPFRPTLHERTRPARAGKNPAGFGETPRELRQQPLVGHLLVVGRDGPGLVQDALRVVDADQVE